MTRFIVICMLFAIDIHLGKCTAPPRATPGFSEYQGNLFMETFNQKELESQSHLCFARTSVSTESNMNNQNLYEKIQFLLDNANLFNTVYDGVLSTALYGVDETLENQLLKESDPKSRAKRQTYPCNCNSGYNNGYNNGYSSSSYSYSSGYPTSQTVSYNSYNPVPQTVVVNNRPKPLKTAVLVGGAAFTGSFVGSRLGNRRRIIG